MELEEIKEKAMEIAKVVGNGNGGRVEIIGSWIWVMFENKPSQEIREYLKSQKAFWNHTRGAWQIHSGNWKWGKSSNKFKKILEYQYGLEKVEEAAI